MNYYKITNEEEKHNNMQYKDGLNVDILPFNPKGDCEKGGIYFSREDILAFLNYGPWIRRVELPKDAKVYENPGEPKKWKSDKVVLGERRRVDINVVRELIEEGADVRADDDFALRWTAGNGHLEIVKLLVEQGANARAKDDYALRWAASNGHLEVVKYLVEQGLSVRAKDDYALRWAAAKSHLEVVKYLVEQGANVRADDDRALRMAAGSGHLEVVKFLESLN